MAPELIKLVFSLVNLKFPVAFDYYSTKVILALITSLLISLYLGPFFIALLYRLKIGQPIRQEECPELAELHKNKENTPTMGGGLIIFSISLSGLLWMDFSWIQSWILMASLLALGALGAYDDFLKLKYKNSKGISSKKKFLFQLLFSMLLMGYFFLSPLQEAVHRYTPVKKIQAKELKLLKEEKLWRRVSVEKPHYFQELYFPFVKKSLLTFSGLGLVLLVAFKIIVIIGSSNAVNLTDGLDGLVSGVLVCTCIPLITFAFLSNNSQLAAYLNVSYVDGSGEVAIFLSAMVGALLGFLWYNAPPAEVFMGDTGSLGLGGSLGVSAILIKREVLLALCGGVLVLETLSVILQVLSYRYRQKKRLFLCAPLHHHFEYKGWPETKVVIRFWILSILFAMLGLASIKFQ